jgi:S1-C subfamily serine protease
VANNDDLYRILEKHQVGDTVQVQVMRNGRRASVPVRLTASVPTRGILRR